MSLFRRLSLLVVVALTLLVALPALAAEEPAEEPAGDASTETTVATDEATEAVDVGPPAVTVPPTAAEEETPDWTYRYLIPTLLALAVIVVIITTVQYFVRVVRSRYKVVE